MKTTKHSLKKNHSRTPIYILFYLVLSEDTWRLGFGIFFAYILTPSILTTREVNYTGKILVYFMLICIGWWLFGYPARKITRVLMGFIRKG
jgi:hypothetical protein